MLWDSYDLVEILDLVDLELLILWWDHFDPDKVFDNFQVDIIWRQYALTAMTFFCLVGDFEFLHLYMHTY